MAVCFSKMVKHTAIFYRYCALWFGEKKIEGTDRYLQIKYL